MSYNINTQPVKVTSQMPTDLLEAIREKILNYQDVSPKDISTLSGGIASLIFLSILGKDGEFVENKLEEMFAFISEHFVPSDAVSGLAGFGWGVNFLCRHQLIDQDENELLGDLDDFLFESAQESIENKSFEFFYGTVGYASYFIERFNSTPSIQPKLFSITQGVLDILEMEKNHWPIQQVDEGEEMDFSISHGVSAAMVFLTKMASLGIERERCCLLISSMAKFIRANSKITSQGVIIPDHLMNGEPSFSPLRWCHGQLGVSYALAYASSIVDDDELLDFAQGAANAIAQIEHSEHQELPTSILCHGTLGVSLALEVIGDKLRSEHLMESALNWREIGLKMIRKEVKGRYVKDNEFQVVGILDGLEGTGLHLLAPTGSPYADWKESMLFY